MPEGMSEMSRFSKVSSIFGRDAFATMRYVTLLNVSEIRDISNDERKVPFKNDEYLASGTSSFRRACKSIIRDNKIRFELNKKKMTRRRQCRVILFYLLFIRNVYADSLLTVCRILQIWYRQHCMLHRKSQS